MIENPFEQVVQAALTNTTLMGRETYLDESDGLQHCAKCGEPAQFWAPYPCSDKKWLAPIRCRCIDEKNRKEQEANEQSLRMSRVKKNTAQAFDAAEMQKWTFSRDDGKRSGVIEIAKRYCIAFDNCKRQGYGAIFYGEVGTGKTFTAGCIANCLLSQGYTVRMTNFSRIAAQLQETFNKDSYYADLAGYDLLIIDDLSSERNTEYMNEQIYTVINARYEARKPIIFTTNLTEDELMNPQGMIRKRIFSRIRERCRFVKFEGKDKRNDKATELTNEYDGIFNF